MIFMPKKQKEIGIVMHIPEDKETLNAIQEKTNQLFARMVEKKLRSLNLTQDEKQYAAKAIARLYSDC